MWSGTLARVLACVTHMKNSPKINWIQIYQFWNTYCNTVGSFVRLKICKILKFCLDELLQIAVRENFCEADFHEHQNFIFVNFTNQLRLPIWIFDVMYYFEQNKIQYFIYLNLLDKKNILWEKIFNLTINAFLWKKWLLEKEKKIG